MYFRLGEAVRKTVIQQARAWFSSSEPIVQDFLWNADITQTKIQIYDQYPEDDAFRPGLTVVAESPASSGEYSLGQYLARVTDDDPGPVGHPNPNYGKVFNKYGGKVKYTISIVAESWTKPNLEILADTVMMGFADGGAIRGLLAAQLIIIEPDAFVRFSNESVRDISQDRKIYSLTMSIPIQVSWCRHVEVVGETLTNAVSENTPSQ